LAYLLSRYILAALDWCLWIANEKRGDQQRQLAANIQDELFRLKLYRNRMEINEYQQSTILNSTVTNSIESYTPDDIQQLLQRTAKFTRT
jgi:hypothetical protein